MEIKMAIKLNSKDDATKHETNNYYRDVNTTVNITGKDSHVDKDVQVPETDKNLDQYKNLKSDRFLIKIFVCLYILEYLSRILSNIGDFLKNLGLT